VAAPLPALSGKQLIALFRLDGWEEADRRTHGIALVKTGPDGQKRIVIIPDKSEDLHPHVLHLILSVKQSGVGRPGLLVMIKRHGIPRGR